MKPLPSRHRLKLYFTFLWLNAVALGGCAGIDFVKASKGDDNGIRYYRPASYFLVTPDYDTGSAKVTIVHAPDTSAVYAAAPYAWFASNKSLIEFDHGMLKTITATADGTKLPKTMIEATVAVAKTTLEELAKQKELALALAKAGAAARLGKTKEPPVVGLPVYLFKATPDGVKLIFGPESVAGDVPRPSPGISK